MAEITALDAPSRCNGRLDLAVTRILVVSNRFLRREVTRLNSYFFKASGRQLSFEFLQDRKDRQPLSDMFPDYKFPQVIYEVGLKPLADRRLMGRIESSGLFAGKSPEDLGERADPSFEEAGLIARGEAITATGATPSVFWVDERLRRGRPLPRSWADLLNPIWSGDVTLDNARHYATNPVYFCLAEMFGMDALERFVGQMETSASNVTSCLGVDKNRSAVHVTVWPFIQSIAHLPYVTVVWPEEGAIPNPHVSLVRHDLDDAGQTILSYLMGRRWATVLGRNRTPSVTLVDDDIARKQLQNAGAPVHGRYCWPGWSRVLGTDFEQFDHRVRTMLAAHRIKGVSSR